MSAMDHQQTSRHVRVMTVIPLKADIHQRGLQVRLVPLMHIAISRRLHLTVGCQPGCVYRRLAQKAARVLERFGTVAVEGRRITVTLRVRGKADMTRTCQYVC